MPRLGLKQTHNLAHKASIPRIPHRHSRSWQTPIRTTAGHQAMLSISRPRSYQTPATSAHTSDPDCCPKKIARQPAKGESRMAIVRTDSSAETGPQHLARFRDTTDSPNPPAASDQLRSIERSLTSALDYHYHYHHHHHYYHYYYDASTCADPRLLMPDPIQLQ